jgi:hypothetical protein
VDNADIGTTDFDIDKGQQDTLFLNGVAQQRTLILMADFNDGNVPRTSNDGKSLVDRRQGGSRITGCGRDFTVLSVTDRGRFRIEGCP